MSIGLPVLAGSSSRLCGGLPWYRLDWQGTVLSRHENLGCQGCQGLASGLTGRPPGVSEPRGDCLALSGRSHHGDLKATWQGVPAALQQAAVPGRDSGLCCSCGSALLTCAFGIKTSQPQNLETPIKWQREWRLGRPWFSIPGVAVSIPSHCRIGVATHSAPARSVEIGRLPLLSSSGSDPLDFGRTTGFCKPA
jgi:hypothetical protein